MPTNIIQFQADLDGFAKKLDIKKSTVVKKVVLDLWTGITRRTPVDTGRARANWFVTQGAPTDRVDLHEGAKTGGVAAPDQPDVGEITGDEPVFIINNLPYIEALENGHSKQAPAGMVKLAIQAEQAALDRAVIEP